MPDRMRINDEITIGAQPSEAELKAMVNEGVQSVINLRTSGEDMQRIEPDEEARIARRLGLTYASLPVAMSEADAALVDDFREALDRVKKPVFVHCKLGKRAGAMVMMDMAARKGWTGDETLEKAEAMGFECDNEQMERFVRDYVDSRREGAP